MSYATWGVGLITHRTPNAKATPGFPLLTKRAAYSMPRVKRLHFWFAQLPMHMLHFCVQLLMHMSHFWFVQLLMQMLHFWCVQLLMQISHFWFVQLLMQTLHFWLVQLLICWKHWYFNGINHPQMRVFHFLGPLSKLKACGYCHYEHDRNVSLDKRQRLLLNRMDAWSNRICVFGLLQAAQVYTPSVYSKYGNS